MIVQRELPPFAVLAAALRKTTERLAVEVVQPSTSPPVWNDLEWAIAQSATAMQGISVLLANRLSWAGPSSWQTFLGEQREQSVLRDERIRSLLAHIDTVLRDRGIACVALKGAALRALDLYQPGERPMGDIDLLVGSGDLLSITHAMADVGYVEAFTVARHVVYEPQHKRAPRGFGEHVDNPLKIEVHTAVAEPLPARKVDITDRLRLGLTSPGLKAYPDRASLLLHLLLHAAGNVRSHTLRQVHLHDIAAIARRLPANDWRALLEPERNADKSWWLFPPLELTARYYTDSIPADVLSAARSMCPRLLRVAAKRQSLTSVSWSNLHIHAFPGIAWSRTPVDALRFVRSRILPSRQSLAELAVARQAQPQLNQVPWYGLTHGRRIARWVFSQPPRVQTMVSVRAALENANLDPRADW